MLFLVFIASSPIVLSSNVINVCDVSNGADDGDECVIECHDNNDCEYSVFVADISNNIGLECNGDYSCYDIQFYADGSNYNQSNNTYDIYDNNNTKSTTISCIGSRSCLSSEFYLSNTHQISIYCGDDEESCSNTQIYCLNCTNINIYFLDSCADSYIETRCFINENKCEIQCKNKRIDLYYLNSFNFITKSLTCIDEYYSCFYPLINNNNSYIHKQVQCNENSKSNHQNADITTLMIWDINYKEHCDAEYNKYFICDNNTLSCNIYCDSLNCINVDINALNVNNLNVICSGSECSESIIYCPRKYCNILCNKNASCYNLNIYAQNTQNINIKCEESSFCSNITIKSFNKDTNHIKPTHTALTWPLVPPHASNPILNIECKSGANCDNISIHSNGRKKVIIKCLSQTTSITKCNNFIIDIFDNESPGFELECIGGINFYSNSLCSNFNIYAKNVSSMNIICNNNNNQFYSCFNMSIFGEYISNTISFNAFGRNSTNNISINAIKEVNNIEITAERDLCLINAKINAINANKFKISCFGAYGNSCSNSEIYLSKLSNNNKLICEGYGCKNVHIYSIYNQININNNNNNDLNNTQMIDILVNGCDVCESIKDCAYNMTLNCNYDGISATKCDNNNKSVVFGDDDDFINDFLVCNPVFNGSFYDNELALCSQIFLFILIAVTIIIMSHFFYEQIIKIYLRKSIRMLFISNQPWNYIYIYSVIIEIILYIIFLYWGIKLILFYTTARSYCSTKYYMINDWQYCANDKYCDLWYGHSSRLDNDICLNTEYDSDNKCECSAETGIYALIITYWICFSLLIINDSLRICSLWSCYYEEKYISAECSNCGGQYLSSVMCCHPDIDIQTKLWYQRKFWININIFDPSQCGCKWWCFAFENIYKYLIIILLSSINSGLYSNYSTNYFIESSVVCSVVFLIIFKMCFQIYYSFGSIYEPLQEIPEQIEYQLSSIFGNHIGYIIRLYMPIFHDKTKCIQSLLLINKVNASGLFVDKQLKENWYHNNIDITYKREYEINEIRRLEAIGNPQDCALNMRWANKWRNFVHKKTNIIPSPIDNDCIYKLNHMLKNGLIRDVDYIMIPTNIWIFLCETYGGGPKIVPINRKLEFVQFNDDDNKEEEEENDHEEKEETENNASIELVVCTQNKQYLRTHSVSSSGETDPL